MSEKGKEETTRELRLDMIAACKVAARELITVAQASIFNSQNDDGQVSNEDVASEKMKIAAQAKKVAAFDCFDILDRADAEEEKVKLADEKIAAPTLTKESEKAPASEKKSDFVSVEGRT